MTRRLPPQSAVLADERGSTIVLVAIAITALLSVVALAVDLGMLFTARGEAQRTADAAALAGAGKLINSDADGARQVARQYGDLNAIRGDTGVVLDEDVVVDLNEFSVTVTARREASRGSAVPTWFARVFGIDEVDVVATATAEAAPAGRAICVKPFALFDRFYDRDNDGVYEPGDRYDPFKHGYGTSWRNPGSPGDDGMGYINDRGREIAVKGGGTTAAGGGSPSKGGSGSYGTGPSWYYPWDVPQGGDVCAGGPTGTGAGCYRWAIENCHPAVIEVGQQYMVADGVMFDPTRAGIRELIAKDPDAYWDESCQCVKGSKYGDAWESSERIGIVPTFDPSREFDPGNRPIQFTNFIAVFFERVEGAGTFQQVHGRILYATGIAGGDRTAPGMKAVRLIR